MNQSKQQICTLDREVRRRVSCRYLLTLPTDADAKSRRAPLVLFLHGAGERGDDIERVKKHGPAKLIERGQSFPFILVAPQCPSGTWWQNGILTALLDEVMEQHAVDADRVYLTGISMGGFATWSLAIETPGKFAAIVPICGGGAPYVADRLKRIPIWAFHGAKDDVVPLYESERMVEAVKKAGGAPKFTVYPDAGHDAWTRTYEDPALWDWLLAQRRDGSENLQA